MANGRVMHSTPLPYQNPIVKRALWNFKYYRRPEETASLAGILYDETVACLSDRVSTMSLRHPAALIHAPSSMYAGGLKDFDHMQVLTEYADTFQDPVYPMWTTLHGAVKIRHTESMDGVVPQHRLNRRGRIISADNRYIISVETTQYIQTHEPHHILCIDDITTTGATLTALSYAVSVVVQNKKCITTRIALAH